MKIRADFSRHIEPIANLVDSLNATNVLSTEYAGEIYSHAMAAYSAGYEKGKSEAAESVRRKALDDLQVLIEKHRSAYTPLEQEGYDDAGFWPHSITFIG